MNCELWYELFIPFLSNIDFKSNGSYLPTNLRQKKPKKVLFAHLFQLYLCLPILGWLWSWKQCLSYFESFMVRSDGVPNVNVVFTSSSSPNVGAGSVLQEVLSEPFYSPKVLTVSDHK